MSPAFEERAGQNVSGVHQKKRIIVCCDGTWVDSDSGYDEKKRILEVPSNVTRFCRALRTESWPSGATSDTPNLPQITYYQAGVGTGEGLYDQLGGGAAGAGIDEHIREAYSFVARNWCHAESNNPDYDDELFFLGFSRGAFTARSIVGFISTVGLLTKRGMDYFYEIFKDYENMNVDDYKNPLQDLKGKPRLDGGDEASQKAYFDYLHNQPEPLTHRKIPTIKAIGVWDTVGSLGVPGIALVDEVKSALGVHVYRKELQFYDTSLAPNVEYAFQALALDEKRHPFTPALWEKIHGVSTKVKQTWFPGVHSNIGGGMTDIELSDITLAWMFSQFEPFLDFDDDYIVKTFKLNKLKGTQRAWACGNIDTKDNNPIYKISGDVIRTPGQYCKANNHSGIQTDVPLENTRERIHSSVRVRLASSHSIGINDEGKYLAEALTAEDNHIWNHILGPHHVIRHGWKLVKNDTKRPVVWENDFEKSEDELPPFYWTCDKAGKGFPNVLVEDTLGVWEKKLLSTQKLEKGFEEFVPKQWV